MKSLLRLLFFTAAGFLLVAVVRGRRSGRGENEANDSSRSRTGKPTYDDIASRAYFIGLEHDRHGEAHDTQHDWAEAETQLVSAE